MIIIEYKIKPMIVQMQITDYTHQLSINRYKMWIPKYYQRARKRFRTWITFRKWKRNKSSNLNHKYLNLSKYYRPLFPTKISKPPYLERFPKIPTSIYEDHAMNVISKLEWDMLHTLKNFKGYFNYIIEFNDFSYFDDLQENLESNGCRFKNIFIHDIIIFELARRQIGIRNYAGIEKFLNFMSTSPFVNLTHNPIYIPTASDISYVMKQIPPKSLIGFFLELVKEAISYGIIYPRILIGDGQFIRSNSNNNKIKNLGRYSDPDAGYCRHNGAKKGVGYDPWCFYAYCGPDRVLPVYFKMFPGNRNDNPAFRKTLTEFINLDIGKWDVVIADSGPYSKKSLEHCKDLGIFPIIRAKKNLKNHPAKELKKGYWFNMDYIPDGWNESHLLKTYEFRPMVEKALAQNNTFYNSSRMNTRGIDNAIRHRVLYYILDLLRALTAYKIGRPNMICKLSSFNTIKTTKFD